MARLPLQLGNSSLASLAVGAAVFVPGAILTGVAAVLWFALDDLGGDVGGYVGAIAFTGALALLMYSARELRRAWQARPSDIRIDADAFVIDGGAHDGLRVRWAHLPRGEKGCRVEKPDPKAEADDENDRDIHRLLLRATNVDVVLAIAEDEKEAAALEEIATTLRAGAASHRDERKRQRKSTKVDAVACPSCGAVVAPEDAGEITCGHCDARVAMPEDIRTRVRESAEIARRPHRVIAKLLDQPSARRVTWYFAVAAIFMLLAWPAAIALFAHAISEHTASFLGALTLLLFVASTILGFFAFVRGRIVDRVALRLLLVELAADAPTAEGEPYRCRACMAPLPSAGIERAIVACAYCRAENVLVRDIHREAEAAREERRSVERALAERKRERDRLGGIGVLAAVLLVVAGLSFGRGFAANPIVAPVAKRCDAGDLDACIDLGDLYMAGAKKGVKLDPKRASKLYVRACDAGRARACSGLAEFHEKYGLLRDDASLKQVAPNRQKACDLGLATSCAALAEMYVKGNFLYGLSRDPAKAKELYAKACAGGVTDACKK